jgi:G3E family GTPase
MCRSKAAPGTTKKGILLVTDIYLITGFLGAGKTTLMKELLQLFKCGRTAVIVNEFGQEGVDGAILEKEGMVIEEIVDGSIFCVCRSDKFIETILKTEELDVDYLIVESSGLADPFGMQEVMGIVNKLSPDKFHYSGSICVVDAKNFNRVYGLAPAAKQQVLGADLVFINKTDISTPAEIKEVEDILQGLNVHAPLIKTSFARIPDNEQIYTLQWRRPDMKGVLLKKTIGISKFTLKFDSVPIDQLTNWLKEWSGRAYRVKGFCEQYFVQSVQNKVSVSEFNNKKEENFLVVLAPASDALKEEIINSWKARFSEAMRINF